VTTILTKINLSKESREQQLNRVKGAGEEEPMQIGDTLFLHKCKLLLKMSLKNKQVLIIALRIQITILRVLRGNLPLRRAAGVPAKP
jgi:hypothetical protein